MNRKRHVLRPIKLTTTLPENVWTKLNLHLYSQVEGRVPQGAIQSFLVSRINEFFDEKQKYLTKEETKVLSAVLIKALEDFPQEWWIELFPNPQEAFNIAYNLSKEISK